ncbi:ATP-binding cassette, subfamily B [Streptomyces zhaozhouensis]|uniref:ATP-binding cassette, subfamily B n=1 Tax=Streptomyces zhaozhouensis TaxID=1300267 RepID=A0A286DSB6_9ACTN|nr:ABC transporter ATP-binding protein [Streptomyces zhaozhouensis]SOD61566.1 ATP-binding cassette, subfamily B [Streptomyces zhaozhouensis]
MRGDRPGAPGEERTTGRLTVRRAARRMAGRFAPYRWQVAASLCVVVLVAGLSVSTNLVIARIIDDALPYGDTALLARLCSLMLAIAVATSVLSVVETALTQWIGQRVTADLRVEVFDRAHSQSLDFYTEHREARVQARLVSDIDGVSRFLTGTAQTILSSFTLLIVSLVIMLTLSWPIAVASMLLAAVLGWVNSRFARKRRLLFSQRQRHLTSLLRYVAEDLSLGGVLLGRTLGRRGAQRARFVEKAELIRDLTYRQRMAGATATALIGATFAGVPPVIYWLAGTWFADLSVGTVVALVILQSRLAGPIQSLLQLSGSLQASMAMFERIIEFLDLRMTEPAAGPPEAQPGAPGPGPGGPARPGSALGVRVRDVSWQYPGTARSALDGVTLDLTAGAVHLLVGRSGSGKSTLALLLAGLLPPQHGSLRTDDTEGPPDPSAAQDRDAMAAVRRSVVLVPQHTTLFDGSLRENLAFVRDGVSTAEMDAALSAVRLDGLVASLPDGYDTPVGGDGHRLSGGERQRVGIARALLADCRMLILDEATSALDPETARAVDRAVRDHCRDRTLVMISHRAPRVEPADRVIVMRRGAVIEQAVGAIPRSTTENDEENHAGSGGEDQRRAQARDRVGIPE